MPCLSLRFVRFRLLGEKGGRVCKVLGQKNYGRHCDSRNFFVQTRRALTLLTRLDPLFQPLQAELTKRSERDGRRKDFDISRKRTKDNQSDFLRDETCQTGIAASLRSFASHNCVKFRINRFALK